MLYLKKALILNSGPLSDLEIDFEFRDNGDPKPVIFVGRNGSGKSNLLSYLTDSLIELAAKNFRDVAPPYEGGGHQWYRIAGGATIRTGAVYELAIISFLECENAITYICKAGNLSKEAVQHRSGFNWCNINWPADGTYKDVRGSKKEEIEKIFRQGCYASFPSSRAEAPYWTKRSEEKERSNFQDAYTQVLKKPIVVSSAIEDIKPWLVDVIMDCLLDARSLMSLGGLAYLALLNTQMQYTIINQFNELLRDIIRIPGARLVRVGRWARNRKLQVYDGETALLPSLDSLSSGQAILLSIFSTVLRYADQGMALSTTGAMQGVVLIDEVDAHLHADLQFEVLPRLIRKFPKIQFVLTTHSPLFVLGMEREFGEEGFNIFELPDGNRISAERFSEFSRSFQFYKETKAFDEEVKIKVSELQRPLIICEGQTDPLYLKTAAELLGFARLASEVDYDWIGKVEHGQAKDGGSGQLERASKLLKNNLSILKAETVLLFDSDVKIQTFDNEHLHVRTLIINSDNKKCNKGIENLLCETVFEDKFFVCKPTEQNGADTITKKTLKKIELCDYLCKKRRREDFEGFRSSLEMLEKTLWPDATQ